MVSRVSSIFDTTSNLGLLDLSATYRLDRHAFTGTMSKFHVATSIKTGERFGIKLLDAEKTAHFRSRFKGLKKPEEGEIALKIKHPRVVETFEFGKTTTGIEYILMEYIHGPGVNTLVKNRDQNLIDNRLMIIRQMAEAIQAVHDAGFIHRDICPRNFIMNHDFKWLKLIDFGLTIPDEPPYHLPGNRTGTPQFMAPEIVRRRQTDRTVDVFSFGVTCYKILTFEHPWGTTDTTGKGAVVHSTRDANDIREHRPNLDDRLVRAIHRCLHRNPAKRMNSTRNFLAMIRDVKTEE